MTTNISDFIRPMERENDYDDYGEKSMYKTGRAEFTVSMYTIIIAAAFVALILFILYRSMFFTGMTGSTERMESFEDTKPFIEDVDKLTKCGWEVHVRPTCPYCIRQKSILEQHFPKFKNIFEDRPAEVVPTWYNTKTGQKIPGMQTPEKLSQMASC